MRPVRDVLIPLCLLVFGFASVATAGNTPPPVHEGVKVLKEKARSVNLASPSSRQLLMVVRNLMRVHNYQDAAGLLESIYEKEPDNEIALNLLRNCYNQLGQPAKSELIVRRLIGLNPGTYVLYIFLAESIAQQADTAHAAAVYDSAYAMIQSNDPNVYRQLVISMSDNGLSDKALGIIQQLRTRLKRPEALAFEAGNIYESDRRYADAANEFFIATADTTRLGIEAENRLLSLLDFQDSSAPAEKTVIKYTTGPDAARAARILSVFYLKHDRTDDAMKYVLLQDSLEGGNGLPLLTFMRTCHDLKKYDRVETVARELLHRYGNAPLLSQARFLYGDALTHLGRYKDAIADYDTVIAEYQRPQDKSEAGYRIGEIYLENLNNPDAALNMFDSVAATFRGGLGYLNSLLAVPFCYLRKGDIARARTEFLKNSNSRLTPDSQEEIEYYLALLSFFDGQYDSTRTALNKLMVDFPRGFYVNDALQLLLVMDEAGDSTALLGDWSRMLLFKERRMTDSLKSKLIEVATNTNTSLADVALYRLARLSLDQFDSTGAIAYIDTLAARFPDSYYMPFGLKLKGDMYLADPAHFDEGRTIYRRLLEKYGTYPFSTEVRKKLRAIEDREVG